MDNPIKASEAAGVLGDKLVPFPFAGLSCTAQFLIRIKFSYVVQLFALVICASQLEVCGLGPSMVNVWLDVHKALT